MQFATTHAENIRLEEVINYECEEINTTWDKYSTFKRLKKPCIISMRMSSEAWQQCDGKCQCQMRE
nr:unnamed protein product [Callosobruchus chinensis]